METPKSIRQWIKMTRTTTSIAWDYKEKKLHVLIVRHSPETVSVFYNFDGGSEYQTICSRASNDWASTHWRKFVERN
jgi:hypothetical protein